MDARRRAQLRSRLLSHSLSAESHGPGLANTKTATAACLWLYPGMGGHTIHVGEQAIIRRHPGKPNDPNRAHTTGRDVRNRGQGRHGLHGEENCLF